LKVGDSIRKSIADWQAGEIEAAMLHACNAIDGTAKKAYPNIQGSNLRFTQLLRDNYHVLGPMGVPGINLVETRFPVKVAKPKALGGQPDMADLIYGIYRCTHGHGNELPGGFELIQNAAGPDNYTRMEFTKEGRARLSDRIIFGLLAVAMLSPVNTDQKVPDGYYLTFGAEKLMINEWWGRVADFSGVVARGNPMPSIKMDFNDWMK
jgi:hypothetical protein